MSTLAEITVDDVLHVYALWRDGPSQLANAMARNLGVLAREIHQLRAIGTDRARDAVERGVEFIESFRDDLWSSYQLNGVVSADADPEVFDELVELSEVIRELHLVVS